MERSIIEDLGEEITAIVTPVSICMLLVVLLVQGLAPEGTPGGPAAAALFLYEEKSTDSTARKLGGALLDSLIFIVAVGAVTFVLVLLFWLRCTKCIWGYMGFSGFTILAFLGGMVAVQVIEAASIPIDIITFSIVLYNFAVVGVLAVFFWKMPIFLKQGYLVFIGAVVAFWFTKLPEWTTWMVLGAMALYDLAAVLAPGGPLKMLVEMSIERNEEIPALIYEARPASLARGTDAMAAHARALPTESTTASPPHRSRGIRRVPQPRQEQAPEAQEIELAGPPAEALQEEEPADVSPDLPRVPRPSPPLSLRGGHPPSPPGSPTSEERRPLMAPPGGSLSRTVDAEQGSEGPADSAVGYTEEEWGLPDAIKLGLGDFIFYSLLVGRAAMYDLLTVYACYLAIIAGLGATLVLLAVYQHALPALPISITLGILFYFLTRLLVEPLAMGIAGHQLFI